MLFLELNSPDAILENINFQVLTAYCNMLHILRPAKAPGFAFAWLEIVSHRVFLGRILAQTAGQKGWPMFAQLLVDLFKFLSPFLRNAELAKPVHRKCFKFFRDSFTFLAKLPQYSPQIFPQFPKYHLASEINSESRSISESSQNILLK